MLKRLWLLAAALLVGCMLYGGPAFAQEEWNAGKTEAAEVGLHGVYPLEKDLDCVYYIHGRISSLSLPPDSLIGEDETEEKVTEYRVTFLSGDEHLREMLRAVQNEDGETRLAVDLRGIEQPGTAEFRIDMISDHYWASKTVHPAVMDADDLHVELLSSDVNVPVGKEVVIKSLFTENAFVKTEPDVGYYCNLYTESGENEYETDGYTIQFDYFKALKPGDYPMKLCVSTEGYGPEIDFPIMIHASEETESAEVVGEAQPTEEWLRRQEKVRRWEEEFSRRQQRQRMRERVEQMKADLGDGEALAETEQAVFVYGPDEYTSGKYMITSIYPLKAELTIPASLDGKSICSVGFGAMDFNNQVTTLRFEEGIERIGKSSFHFMDQLKEVFLPNSLKSIEMHAFSGDHSLMEIHFPASFSAGRTEMHAFYGIGAKSLVLPDGTDLMAASMKAYQAEGDKDAYDIKYACAQDGLIYLVRDDGGCVIIDGYDQGESLTVPQSMNGHPVREIGAYAFAHHSMLTSVILPEGLEKIGENAFLNCEQLRDISLPSTLKEVGNRAFMGIAAENLTLPEDIGSIADDVYGSTDKTDASGKWSYRILADGSAVLTNYEYTEKMVFPVEVDGIPVSQIDGAVWSSEGSEKKGQVTELFVPEGIRMLGKQAFINMYSLKKVSLPTTLTRIGEQAFENCNKLTSLTIPEGVKVIEKSAFEQCRSLAALELPSTLEEIHESAFRALYALKKPVKLPDGLRVIGDYAFYGSKVTEWTIPASVQSIGDYALSAQAGERFLRKVTFHGANTALGIGVLGHAYGDGAYYYSTPVSFPRPPLLSLTCWPGSTADRMFTYHVRKNYFKWGQESIRTAPADRVLQPGLIAPDEPVYELVIPEGVVEIADNAFTGLSLYRVSLPSTLKVIGKEAFADCAALTDIKLPKSLITLGEDCFRGCSSLKKAEIPSGVRIIPDRAFQGCGNIETLILPEGLEAIGAQAFAVNPRDVQAVYDASDGKTTFAKLKSLKLPSTLISIGDSAFMGNDALTKVSFMKNSRLSRIDGYAFAACLSLKEMTLPDSLQSVGSQAFVNCWRLQKVDLGKGLTSVGDELFANCISLKTLKAPDTLTEIGNNLLNGCRSSLVISCPEGSTMDQYMQQNYSMLKVNHR